MFKKKFSHKESFPPIVGIYITKCLYSITYYWEKIVPQLKFLRVTHDFIVFQCLSVVFTLKIIDHLNDGPKNVNELAKLTNSSEKNLFRVMRALTHEGFFYYNEETNKFANNNVSKLLDSTPMQRLSDQDNNSSRSGSNCSSRSSSPISLNSGYNKNLKFKNNYNINSGNGVTNSGSCGVGANNVNNVGSGGSVSFVSSVASANSNINTFSTKKMSPISSLNNRSNLTTFMESKDSFYLDGFNGDFHDDDDFDDVREENISCLLSMLQYPAFIESWQKLRECVQSSVPGFQIKHGASFFQYIDEKDSYLKKIFDCSMKQKNQLLKTNQQISTLFNFNDYPVICDIGGGVGFLGFEILKKHPKCSVIVLELDETVKNGVELSNFDKTKRHFIESERIQFKPGDMFQPSSIPRANLYVLMQVVHDWNNSDAIRILSSISCVMRKQAQFSGQNEQKPRLIIIDAIVDEQVGNTDFSSKSVLISDIIMMAIVGGEERSKKQWDFLFQESNLILLNTFKFSYPPFLSIMELSI